MLKSFTSFLEGDYIFEATQDGIEANFDALEEFDELLEATVVLTEKSQIVALSPQVWGQAKVSANDSESDIRKKIENVYSIALASATKNFNTLKRGLIKTGQKTKTKKPKILVDIKKLDSFYDKVALRGKSSADINDVLRSAVLLDTEADVREMGKQIKKNFKVAKYEAKERGGDEKFGYFGSHHFIVKVGDMFAEIQVMTKKLWTYKEEAHKIYVDLRSKNLDGEKLSKEKQKEIAQTLRKSKQIFAKGNIDDPFKKDRSRKR